jgi:hypothetical protein
MFGIPLPLAAFGVFLGLKLSDTIDWSWWWVTAPLWASAALFLAMFALTAVLTTLALTIKRALK